MHGPMDEQESEDGDAPFVEMDPSGRYGRYNKVLGKGAFKTVYWAFDELEGMEVAWNQVKVRDVLQQSENLERMYAEVHLLKTLKHKNILKFYNSWVDTKNNNINFITEIFTSGTLRQYRRRHKRADMKAVKIWSRQILRGLLYLHSHDPPIIHRDLKCDNIFVNGSQGEVKIGDLGLAVILRQAHAAHSVIGTPEFMAPELYEEEYDELVDIYSFGMCLLEMVTFEYPYSECANAAQIYKKVSSGIKPAALDKVKDPEVRQFVEKCLATASRRLPARELLMDPFLQIEGNTETMDFVPHPRQLHSWRDGTSEWKTISEEPRVANNSPKDNSVLNCSLPDRNNFKREEVLKLPVHSNAAMGSSSHPESVEMVNHHCLDNCLEADLASMRGKQECMRGCRDFEVKGKRRDGNTIFLRLRIADSRGLVRNIHFPFDIDFDTALCVASEMVAELDLSDQDVTAIADMIDVEIEALVPEWKPGLAFEDTSDCCNNSSVGGYSSDIPSDGDHPSGAFVLERLPSGRMYWSQSPMVSVDEDPAKPGPMNAPSKFEGLLHGRFEELTRHQSGSSSAPDQSDEIKPDQSDEINFPSEFDCQVEDAGDLNTGDHSASQTYSGKAVVNKKTPVIYQHKEHSPSKVVKSTAEAEVRRHPSNLQIQGTRRKSPEDSRGAYGLNQPEFAGQHKAMCENQRGAALWEGADNGTNPPLESDRRIAQELENLALQQQHELEVLKRRHQQALEDLKNRLCPRDCTVNPSKNSLSTTVETQYKFPINCSASVSSENKSERLSLNEIAAVSARINEINGEVVSSASTLDSGLAGAFQEIHQTNFCESNIPNHDFGMQVLPQKHTSISSSRLGASVNVKAQEKLPHSSQDDRSTQQLSGGRSKFDGYIGNSTPFVSEMNAAAQGGLSTKPPDVEMGVRDGTDERNKEPSEQLKSRRHIVDANSSERVSLEECHSVKSILCKETWNAAVFKDVNGETGKSGSKFGLAGRDEANGLRAASLEQKISNKQPRQLSSVKSVGPLDCLSLADSALNVETNHLKLNASAARKCSKQEAMGLPCELAGNAFKASGKSCTNSSCDVGKLRKHLSYIGFYKGGISPNKGKSNSFQGNTKPSDQGSMGDLSSNLSKPSSTDKGLEQLKKQQLQKSIAEFEAKTLEGLRRSKIAYLVSSSVKKQSTNGGSHAGRFRPNDSTTMR